MKKLLTLFLALMLAGCTAASSASSAVSSSAEEPEVQEEEGPVLNTKRLNMQGYRWLEDDDPAFMQISWQEAYRLFDEEGTAVLVYSYDTCPFCNRAIPVLNEVLKEKGMKAYYVDIYEPEMTTLTTEEQFNVDLHKLYDYLDSVLTKEVNPNTGKLEPAFYVPEVLAIKDGQIVKDHCSLTEDFKMEDENTQMTDEQRAELKGIYEEICDAVNE